MTSDTCTYLIRGKRQCIREAAEGGSTCQFHCKDELARQKVIRDKRREQIVESGQARRRVDVLELLKKMKKIECDLAPVANGVCFMKEAGVLFDTMCTQQKTVWQKAKRSWHQPQIESLAKHISSLGILSKDTILLELGAGKGLLGAIIGKLNACNVVVLDKREGGMGGCGDNDGSCGIKRVHADLSDTPLHEVTGGKGSVIVAKHFCGDATDLALRSLKNPDASIKAALVAPCCHPKTAFEKYSGKDYLSDQGFDSNDFEALLVLMEISRERTQHKHQSYGKKVFNLDKVPYEELYRIGRLARRIVEEGRVQYLKQSWRRVRVVEYVPHTVTPDNLFLLAENTENCTPMLMISGAPTQYSGSGVILHLTSRALSDLPMRTVEYLLEKRDRGHLAIDMVWTADMRLDRVVADGCSTEVVVLHTDTPFRLLQELKKDSLLERVVDKVFPFTNTSATLREALNKEIVTDKLNRVYAYPKALEQEAVVLLGETAPLHTTKFTCVANVFEWSLETGAAPTYLSSSCCVHEWNPREWPCLGSTTPAPRTVARMHELMDRMKVHINVGTTVTLVTTKGADYTSLIEYFSDIGVKVAVTYAHVSATSVSLTPVSRAECLIVLLDNPKEDVLRVLQALPRDPCTVVCSLKICPPAKRNNPSAVKTAHAKIASELHSVVQKLEVLHLLCDRDNERTITCFSGEA
eukprot:TRINITY_DN8665_c0_g1_i1.p1 TRINITY_DN8665_c0_g1~~TRINITY_DN8665_c0_g1_i1.p1  ORF type:complete len:695 (+),score=107.90 TRINITY_DN8665_c0_g1_i1:664-2748(+)